MALITVNVNETDRVAKEVAHRVDQLYNTIVSEIDNISALVWRNGLVAPADIFAKLGTDGYKLFAYSAALVQVANTANPSNPITITIPYEYTINPDGSVTVGSLIE